MSRHSSLQLLAIISAIAMLAAGVLFRRNMAEPAPQSTIGTADAEELQDLETLLSRQDEELQLLRRQVAEQRQIIREHALGDEVRSLDEMLALFPAPFPEGDWSPAERDFEDCWFEAVDGIRLHGWYLPHDNPRAVLLHLHGNAGNITHRAEVAEFLHERYGISIMLFDYRGYGRSEGVPTIEGLVRDAQAARDYLAMRADISPESIVLLGRSLGGAIAVQLASEDGARGLILESTFSSLREVSSNHYPALLVNLLVADRLDSVTAIANYDGPLLQCHGGFDRTIPIELGRDLFAAAREPKTFITMPGLDHNDWPSDEYYDALDEFFIELPPLPVHATR